MVTHTVPVGAGPSAIAITPDGRTAVVSNNSGNTVSIIDVLTGTVTNTVTVGLKPSGIAISPDGATAYITVYGTFGSPDPCLSAVQWLDIATATIVRTERPLNNPSGVIASSDGLFIYVWSGALGQVVVKIRVSDGAVFTPSYFIGGSSISAVALSPNGRSLAISPVTNTVGVDIVDTDTMNLLQTIPLAIDLGEVTYSTDGGSLYVSDSTRNEIAVVDTSTYNVTRWSSGGVDPQGLVASDTGTVFVSNRNGNSVASLRAGTTLGTAAVVNPQTPVLTDTREYVLVPSQSGNALAIINTSNMQRELVQVGTSPVNVATARGYAVVSNSGSNTVSIIRLADLPASGDQVPTAPLQQFGRIEAHVCSADIPDSVLFPGVGQDQRADGWNKSWAEWPNGGTGGFVCTRQPYYTYTGQWSVS